MDRVQSKSYGVVVVSVSYGVVIKTIRFTTNILICRYVKKYFEALFMSIFTFLDICRASLQLMQTFFHKKKYQYYVIF